MTDFHDDAPVSSQNDTIFVVFELSKKKWWLGVVLPGSSKMSRYSVEGGNKGEVERLLERARQKVVRRNGGSVQVVSAYEAGQEGFWLHRWLAQLGVTNYVIDPASVHVSRRKRRAKTDRLDLDLLMRTLLAYDRGEPRVCSMAVPPSVEEEDRRRVTRERERLIKERTQHINRIKGLLRAQGISNVDPKTADFAKKLSTLTTGDGHPLEQNLINELTREHARLRLVCEQFSDLTTQMRAARRTASPGSAETRVVQLMQLKGLGEVAAEGLHNEVFFRRFNNRRELGSYLGLTGTPFNSGTSRREQGVSKAGNPRARTLSIELAWLWIRHQPDSALTRWFCERVGDNKGGVRRTMVVALARKLMIALWRYLESGLIPEGAVCRRTARG